MEAGKVVHRGKARSIDLIDAMVAAADTDVTEAEVAIIERAACPTCGSCSGMFTANSTNCLVEALGLGLPGNGTVVATHSDRKEWFLEAGRKIVEITRRHYELDDGSVLPRAVASFAAFENAMTLDIAMGGSTNTVLHLLALRMKAKYRLPCSTSTDCRGACRYYARSPRRCPMCMWRMFMPRAGLWPFSVSWSVPG